MFEINAHLLINLCTCIRILISLFYKSCGAKLNTFCRIYEVVEAAHGKLYDKVILKFVIGCC